jgi:hypothetical protein
MDQCSKCHVDEFKPASLRENGRNIERKILHFAILESGHSKFILDKCHD